MKKVMERLEIPIPKFKLSRWADIELFEGRKMLVTGIDEQGKPLNTFKYTIGFFDARSEN